MLPSSGSFGEIFSLLWEVFFNEDLGEHGHTVETMIAELPSVSRVEEIATRVPLDFALVAMPYTLIDQASLQAQRKLTIPFLKETLGWKIAG